MSFIMSLNVVGQPSYPLHAASKFFDKPGQICLKGATGPNLHVEWEDKATQSKIGISDLQPEKTPKTMCPPHNKFNDKILTYEFWTCLKIKKHYFLILVEICVL